MWSTINQEHPFSKTDKNDVQAYITALVKSLNGIVIITGGASNHIHLLLHVPPDLSLSNLMKNIKAYSSKWLKSHKKVSNNFSWDPGYIAISTQRDRVEKVCEYIEADETRHLTQSYSEEVLSMLNQQGIQFNEKYYLQNSHSKVYVHAIWSTHYRMPWLNKEICQALYLRIGEIISNLGGVMHEIGGVEDHLHLLLEMPKDHALSDIIREIKTSTTHWLKMADRSMFRDFEWQIGFGGFTVSLAAIQTIKSYIQKQEEHHRTKSFQEEWNDFIVTN